MHALRPDELVRPGNRLGHAVIVKLRTGSTNDDARALAEAGAAEGVVVLAEEQESGRGRLDHRWISEAGHNLLFTVVLRPRDLDRPGLITLAAGAGVAAAARAEGVDARVKWPNDVLVGGRKLSGILCEAGRGPGGYFVVLGIGINVNQTSFPPDLAATSLALELGRDQDRPPIFRRTLAQLERAFALAETDAPALLAEWTERSGCRGRRVRVDTPAGEVTGELVGVNQDGALVVRERDGQERAVIAGEVSWPED